MIVEFIFCFLCLTAVFDVIDFVAIFYLYICRVSLIVHHFVHFHFLWIDLWLVCKILLFIFVIVFVVNIVLIIFIFIVTIVVVLIFIVVDCHSDFPFEQWAAIFNLWLTFLFCQKLNSFYYCFCNGKFSELSSVNFLSGIQTHESKISILIR